MQRIILDVDPGHDDAAAIMFAARSEGIKLEGITVAAGNSSLEKTLANALNVCAALEIDAPVCAGAQKPLFRELKGAELIHGESGLDGPVFEQHCRKPSEKSAVSFITETVNANPGEITVVAVAPLTNVASALLAEPQIAPKIKRIVLMGGAAGRGNATPSAEFNIFTDPEAADVVFRSGVPIVMVGLDATTKVLVGEENVRRIGKIGTRASRIFCASMAFYMKSCAEYLGECPAMHDPCCIAYLLEPSIFRCEPYHVAVETKGEHTLGRTVVDFAGVTRQKPNALVALDADSARFWPLFEKALANGV